MAGIAGVIYSDPSFINKLIVTMLGAIQHRGESSKEFYNYKNIQLGICGNTFFSNEKKNIHVALDGFIDNHHQLHIQLEKLGYHCQTDNHSELIVHAYSHWKNSFLEHINGSFALCILDCEAEVLVLARDRIGKKPLYWYQDQHYFLFSSELKAIMATGVVPQTPAEDAIASYLYFGYIPQDMSPIKNVNKLLPSYYLQYLNKNGSKQIQCYWSFSSYFESTEPKTPFLTHMNHLLTKSVQNLLPKEKAVGYFLSGGLGSSCVASYLKNESKQPIFAFTAEFQGQNEQDVVAAKEVAADLKLIHRCETITPQNYLDDLVKIIWHLDVPIADPHVLATWKLSSIASENTDLFFSGMGSDELLAGHHQYPHKNQFFNPFPMLAKILVPILKHLYKPAAYSCLKKARTNPWQFDYLRKNALFDESQLTFVSPSLSPLFDPEVFLHKFHKLPKIKSRISSLLYLDVKTRLPDCYVLQFERLTAAHNLQWCTPFLDRHIIEYLASIPESETLAHKDSERFLKELLSGVLSSSVVDRPRRNRKEFLKSWIETSHLKEVFPLLLQGTLVENGFISRGWLKGKLRSIETQRESFSQLWGILVLEIWFRLYINRPISQSSPNISVENLLQGHDYA